jgi:hypothetical protein
MFSLFFDCDLRKLFFDSRSDMLGLDDESFRGTPRLRFGVYILLYY